MLKRHEIQVLRRAGHTWAEVAALSAPTVRRLVERRRAQAELKMRNRTSYHDLGLVFAKEWQDVRGGAESLGLPLHYGNFGQRKFAQVITTGKLRRIKFPRSSPHERDAPPRRRRATARRGCPAGTPKGAHDAGNLCPRSTRSRRAGRANARWDSVSGDCVKRIANGPAYRLVSGRRVSSP
jgi:hypothetical protein